MPFLGASRSFPSTLPCLLLAILLFPRETLSSTEFHKHMTSEELQHVFQVSSHDEVPDYELVHIRSISKRDASSVDDKLIHVKAFGKDYSLRLEKNPHLLKSPNHLKVLLADIKNGTLQFEEAPPQARNFSENLGDPYHDTTNEAAVVIRHDKYGTLHMDGTIGKTLAIKPAPVSIKKEVNRKAVDRLVAAPADDEMFLDEEYPPYTPKNNLTGSDEEDDSYETNGLHIVFKRKRAELEEGSDYLLMEPDQSPVLSRRIRSFYFKREAPDTIWPEVLVIADYDTYSMHGGNSVNIKRYFVSFWNGVDLRYKLLVGPRVRISLAGIIISKGRDATPYLENNRVHGDAVDSAAALTDMGKYLFRERRLPTYDLAVVVTKLDLCRRQFQAGTCNTGTAGFAYVGGACVVNSRLEKVNSVAIVEDTGGFSGIIVAAHEVGHLLGAVHDGSPAPNYLGGPGAEHCRWEDGYIMSDLRHTERGFQWSSCSVQQFKHFLNSDTATCLHNIPHEDEELPRILPGKLLSLDAQCRKDRGTSACFKDDRVCAQLFCFDSKSGYCVSYRPAAEGSPCGEGHYCVNGRCIPELDNYISDFTKISETVVSKPDTPATEPRPLFSKQRSRTTQDSWSVTTTTVSPTRSRKFHYNTVVRKVSVERTTPSAFDDADPPPDQEIEDDVGRAQDRNDPGCEDVMQTLAGGLTCKQFLRNYGDRYCSHPFIVSNCCASREIVCNV